MKNSTSTLCSRPGSNRGPSACEADVITTTLRKQRLKRFPSLKATNVGDQILPGVGWLVTEAKRQQGGPVAQRITRLTTDQKIAGSNPARDVFLFLKKRFFFFWICMLYVISFT